MKFLELKVPPVFVVLAFVLAMYPIHLFLTSFRVNFNLNLGCAIALIFIGFIIAVLGVLEFKKSRTTLDPRYPHKSSRLVTRGIYQYSRNPMYLGFLIALFGCAFYFSNIIAFVLPPLFILYMNRFQIEPEERFMHKNFQGAFEDYSKQVRRWI